MPDKYREQRVCNNCGSGNYKVLHYFPPDYYSSSAFQKYSWDGNLNLDLTIVKCKMCGLVYTNPSFCSDSFVHIYPETIIPGDTGIKDILASSGKFVYLMKNLKEYFSQPSQTIVFDIGTRYGALPFLLNKEGFKGFGLEYNRACVEMAKKNGIEGVFCGTIDDLSEIAKKNNIQGINCFVMDDVLEHLINPMKDIGQLALFQKKGDILVLKQMNIDSLGYKMFGKNWYYFHAQHMTYYNRETISFLLKKNNYSIVKFHAIPWYKNLKQIPDETMKCIKHDYYRRKLNKGPKPQSLKWFADFRPKLFDMMFVIAQKNN